MKLTTRITLALLLAGISLSLHAQRSIRDEHITNQQERMVFKQWSKNKFTPKGGWLGLNPNYLLTWVWHPDYPKKDLRPLSAAGPQTQRLLLVAAMQNTENAYKLHADTLRNTALSEAAGYTGIGSAADPLWLLYYQHEFDPLMNQQEGQLLDGTEPQVRDYLTRTGVLDWYLEESHALAERLEAARSTTVERGSRIIAYHRMLDEYRKLLTTWEAGKQRARLYLSLTGTRDKVKSGGQPIVPKPGRTDRQIADDILSKSKL